MGSARGGYCSSTLSRRPAAKSDESSASAWSTMPTPPRTASRRHLEGSLSEMLFVLGFYMFQHCGEIQRFIPGANFPQTLNRPRRGPENQWVAGFAGSDWEREQLQDIATEFNLSQSPHIPFPSIGFCGEKVSILLSNLFSTPIGTSAMILEASAADAKELRNVSKSISKRLDASIAMTSSSRIS